MEENFKNPLINITEENINNGLNSTEFENSKKEKLEYSKEIDKLKQEILFLKSLNNNSKKSYSSNNTKFTFLDNLSVTNKNKFTKFTEIQ